MALSPHRRDEFFTRWRRWYKVVYRRITGVKQCLPDDYQARITLITLIALKVPKKFSTLRPGYP